MDTGGKNQAVQRGATPAWQVLTRTRGVGKKNCGGRSESRKQEHEGGLGLSQITLEGAKSTKQRLFSVPTHLTLYRPDFWTCHWLMPNSTVSIKRGTSTINW
jgi:hypothetical protein